MLLEHIKSVTPDAELEAEYAALEEQVSGILNHISTLMESPMDAMGDRMQGGDQRMGDIGNMPPPPGTIDPSGEGEGDADMEEIMAGMETVMKQMEAAKKGLGIINTMADSAYRTKTRSRIMSNMNRIRGNLVRIEKMLGGGIQENIDMDGVKTAMKKNNKKGLKDPFHMKKKKAVKK